MVLSTLLIVAALATIILNIILSHARLTHHQSSRIQANNAAMAGINYGLEKLRLGSAGGGWTAGTDCTTASPCYINDLDFPKSIQNQQVKIIIIPAGPGCPSPPAPAGGACVNATAVYTYTSP